MCAKPSHQLVNVCQPVPDRSTIDEDQRAENRHPFEYAANGASFGFTPVRRQDHRILPKPVMLKKTPHNTCTVQSVVFIAIPL
jgi:hypothetical protein